MIKTLSSSLTWFYKFILSALIIIIPGYFALGAFISSNQSGALRIVFSILFILGISIAYFIFHKIKKVQVEGTTLVISNYLKSIKVEFSEVEKASYHYLISPPLVWLSLRKETEFGKTIFFVPKDVFPFGAHANEVLQEINSGIKKEIF